INNGGILEASGGIAMSGSSSENYLTVANGGLLKLGGNMTGGSLDAAVGSTVEFNADGNQNIYSTGWYHNLTIKGNGVKSLGGDVRVDGEMIIDVDATLALGGSDIVIDLNGSKALTVNGTLHISGSGRITESGSGTKTLKLGPGALLLLTGSNSGMPTLNAYDFDATSTVNYGSGGSQTIENSVTYGNLTTSGNGTKTLESSGNSMT